MGIKMLHVKEFLEAKRTSGEKSEEHNKELEKWIGRAKDIAKLYRMAYGDDAEWCYETWYKRSFNSCSSGGSRRREVIWMNYEDNRQMTLDEYMMKFE